MDAQHSCKCISGLAAKYDGTPFVACKFKSITEATNHYGIRHGLITLDSIIVNDTTIYGTFINDRIFRQYCMGAAKTKCRYGIPSFCGFVDFVKLADIYFATIDGCVYSTYVALPPGAHEGQYNLPTSNGTVACIIIGDQQLGASKNKIAVTAVNGETKYLNVGAQSDPLSYTFFFPYATSGYFFDINNKKKTNKDGIDII